MGASIRKLLLKMEQEHWVFSLKKAKFFYLRAESTFVITLKVRLKQVEPGSIPLITFFPHKSPMFEMNQI